ncbi:MAG: DNA translocase FtsK 4TM domain-containing protein [Alphaproteobacteria bacterium]|nr:DNA translocase FtsK 4TM domain-containing protein [Alphaproteobacteria bacterium]
MTGRSHGIRTVPFLPERMRASLRRHAIEAGAAGLAAAGLVWLTAVASYNPGDPSWNTSSPLPADNLAGSAGAWLADAGLQTFGWAAAVPALAMLAWGWRLWREQRLPSPWLRLTGLVLAMAMAPAALSATGLLNGGVVGGFLASRLGAAMGMPAAMGLSLFATLAALAFAAGLRLAEGRAAFAGGAAALRNMSRAARAALSLLRRNRTVPDEQPPAAPSRPSKARKRKAPAAARGATKVVAPRQARGGKREERERQGDLGLDGEGFSLPPLDLLAEPDGQHAAADDEALEQNARMLETVLQDFGVRGEILRVHQGPVVTRYELEPAPGTRAARVVALADDIARSMSAVSARVATIPGRNVIGIELPNAEREIIFLRELMGSRDYEKSSAELPLILGKDISGAPIIADLARMPHLLVAGTTGSGKSVAVNSMILSLLYRHTPEQVRLVMIDPKMLELSVYDDIPHLLHPVVVDPNQAVVALKWAVKEMNARYRLMSQLNVRNIGGYNKRLAEARAKDEVLEHTVQTGFDPETGKPIYESEPIDTAPLPFIVVVVDEMADLMLVAGKDIEGAIQSLAQKARAAGIHLIIATQRPSVDVITGTIKANLPTRISFQVTSKIDSRTILGQQGAEQLLGMGDMLYMAGGGQLTRVHGPFVADGEVEAAADFLREQGSPDYRESITAESDDDALPGMGAGGGGGSGDELFDKAVDLVARERKASTSFVQRHLSIGYNRAAKIIERMEAEGMVGAANHVGKREVLLPEPGEHI